MSSFKVVNKVKRLWQIVDARLRPTRSDEGKGDALWLGYVSIMSYSDFDAKP